MERAEQDRGRSRDVAAEVRRHQLAHLRRVLPALIVGGILAPLILAIGLRTHGNATELAIWLVAVLAPFAHLIRVRLLRKHIPARGDEQRILLRITLFAAWLGAGWAYAAFALFTLESIPRLFLLAMTLGCLTSAAAGALQVVPRAASVFILPVVLAFTTAFALEGGAGNRLTAAMVLVYGGLLVLLSHYGFRRFIDMVDAKEAARQARDLADAANRAKSTFLATMSHELRTPLNAIIGFAELLERTGASRPDGKAVDYARTIADAGRHLLSLINDILDLSKVEAGRFDVHPEPLYPGRLASDVIVMMQPQADAAGVALSLEMPGGLPLLEADPRALRQIVLNLISNAIKFTPAGGAVSVGVHRRRDGIEIVVEDTGEGIPANQIERVLEPFMQVEEAFSRRRGGTGLGLPLVKSLTELQGGSFRLTSEPGRGTRASVHFPEHCLAPANVDGKAACDTQSVAGSPPVRSASKSR